MNSQQTSHTREQLLELAFQWIAKVNWQTFSLEAFIADEKLASDTVYSLFDDKYAVLTQLCELIDNKSLAQYEQSEQPSG